MPHLGELAALVHEMSKAPVYALQYDYIDATTSYRGEAHPGSATSDAAWRIQRITISGDDLATEWADGSSAFSQVWDDRASLTYS